MGRKLVEPNFCFFSPPPSTKKVHYKKCQNENKSKLFKIDRNDEKFVMGWDTLLRGGFYASLEIAPNKNIKWVAHKWTPAQKTKQKNFSPTNKMFFCLNLKFSGFSDSPQNFNICATLKHILWNGKCTKYKCTPSLRLGSG